MARLIAALVLALTALPFVGCGETVIDATKAEEALQANLKIAERKSLLRRLSIGTEGRSRRHVYLHVKLLQRQAETATLKIRNKEADVSVIHLSGTSQQGQ